jgi:hypothetical protein
MMFVLISQRKHDEALPFCHIAMTDPDKNKQLMAKFTRGLTYLMVGDYPRGFADQETRTQFRELTDVSHFSKINGKKQWDGKPVDHLLIYGEQGFGDIIMFSRFIKQILERGLAKRITLEVHESIVPIMQYNLPVTVVPHAPETIESDAFMLMMNLPLILGTTIERLPPISFKAESKYIEQWKPLMRTMKKFKVGLCWSGRPAKDVHTKCWNGMRNIPPHYFAPLIKHFKDVSFVSLQNANNPEELKVLDGIHDFSAQITSWSDTAAIMDQLDLIISIDSGPVHMAAALGKNVWLLNHVNTCWRWGQSGPTTPWYDNVRIFRQPTEGDWITPMNQVAEELNALVNKPHT